MEISTERTTIRNFNSNDFNDLFEYLSLPETYLYEPGEPINIEQAKEITMERSKGNNFFAVVYKPERQADLHILKEYLSGYAADISVKRLHYFWIAEYKTIEMQN